MKAIRVKNFGGPEVLQLTEMPAFLPSPDQIVVSIKAAGVNPVDAYIRTGQYPISINLPYTPGSDGAGVVSFVGEDVRNFNVGDRVCVTGSLTGTYAEQALCLSQHVFPLPDEISFEQGAAIGVPYATAFRALFSKACPGDNDIILIHGASGGVGVAATQLARMANLRIIGTAGSEKGLALVRQQGADYVLNHSQTGYLDEIMTITQGHGVDVILEMLANVNLGQDLKVLAKNGRVVIIGSRGVVSLDPRDAMMRETTMIGMTLMSAPLEEKAKIYTALERGLIEKQLVPVIGKRFPLREAPLAHEAVMMPGAYGKIVLEL